MCLWLWLIGSTLNLYMQSDYIKTTTHVRPFASHVARSSAWWLSLVLPYTFTRSFHQCCTSACIPMMWPPIRISSSAPFNGFLMDFYNGIQIWHCAAGVCVCATVLPRLCCTVPCGDSDIYWLQQVIVVHACTPACVTLAWGIFNLHNVQECIGVG